MDDKVYEEYIKLFFANLESKKDEETLEIFMSGRTELIIPSLMNRFMGTSKKGVKLTTSKAIKKKSITSFLFMLST